MPCTRTLVGVEALGRPTAYSPDDDSTVRRRAYALRQKLDEVYSKELAGAAVRIEVPKGAYVPRFTLHVASLVLRHLLSRPRRRRLRPVAR